MRSASHIVVAWTRCGVFGEHDQINVWTKGVFLTTSYFTKPAVAFAEHHPYKIVLIDGELLAPG